MSSKTDICNMALSHIGALNTIANIDTDNSLQGKQCRVFYDQALEFVLADVDWGFASSRIILSELSEDSPIDWDFVYVYPSDCVQLREIYTGARRAGVESIPYEIGLNADKTIKVIYCDLFQANLRYTSLVTDSNLFTSSFRFSLSWYLAFLIAWPLTKKAAVRGFAEKEYIKSKQEAATHNALEDNVDSLPDSESIRSRGAS